MRSRLVMLVAGLIVWSILIAARLYRVQVLEHPAWAERAGSQQLVEVELSPPRGTIYDRQGRLLAVSAAVESAFIARPSAADPQEIVHRIASLGLDTRGLESRLAEGAWSWIGRQLEPRVAERLRALDIEGVDFVAESKRFYPLGDLAAPVLGFVGVDHVGLAGVEATYNREVAGEAVQRPLLRDARRQRMVGPSVSFLDAKAGEDLHLTIDSAVQYIVERELRSAMDRHAAKAAAAVLMDPSSGAVYAMVSLPSFDPNRFVDFEPALWRNRAVELAYEPGSTFKLVTVAAALDQNLVDSLDIIDCEQGAIQLARTRIRDHKPFGELSLHEVFAKSSNVGAIKVGLMVGPDSLAEEIDRFGFGRPTGIDLPGEASGIVRPVARWAKHEAAYASIGQGIAVSPVQLVRAFAAVANGGRLVEPHVVGQVGGRAREERPLSMAEPVLTPATHRTLLRMLEAVVENGTGTQAAVDGYRVAGKTGTAQIPVSGGYAENRHIASFVGFAPSRSPRLVGLVAVFEPRGAYHGGDVAAPVFAAIFRQVLPLLGVTPGRRDQAIGELATRIAVHETGPSREVRETRRAMAAGTVPDFSGLTARQALTLGAELGLHIELQGSGFVAAQRPAAGEPLAGQVALLELRLPGGQAG